MNSFREIINKWDEAADNLKIKAMLEDNGLVLFFKKDDSIFGAPEMSRVTFARMKHPEDDDDEEWSNEASFLAFDLLKALEGQRTKSIFGKKDIDIIKLLDQDLVQKLLTKKLRGHEKTLVIDLNDDKDDDSPTIDKISEKE